ncbi:NARE ribosyltransferase, partial [Donacobius atricapilla]|nr:NARE ribosyltransferase [Donacobius atricapilla]
CGPAMTRALPALNRSEFQKNSDFARVWAMAAAEWQSRGSRVSPLPPDQAIAVMAFTMGAHSTFNAAVRVAGRSSQHYRHSFHFKTLHFLLTQALETLRHAQAGPCLDAFQEVCGVQFEAQRGDTVRFGHFRVMSPTESSGHCSGKETLFRVHTCHSMYIQFLSKYLGDWRVLIPPFETFQVTEVTQEGDKSQIHLISAGTHSKYNCEWLRGNATGPCVLGVG